MDKLSDQCRERLREIERKLSESVVRLRDMGNDDIRIVGQVLMVKGTFGKNIADAANDPECQRMLRDLEPKLGNAYSFRGPAIKLENIPDVLEMTLTEVRAALYRHD